MFTRARHAPICRTAMIAASLWLLPVPMPGQATPRHQPSTAAGAVVGGVLAGGLGFVGGALFATSVECNGGSSCQGFDALEAAVLGAIVGEILFLPIGVHVGNGQAGSIEADLLTSVFSGLGALGIGLAAERVEVLAIGIAGQIAFTVAMERMRGRQRTENVGLILGPASGGGVFIGARIRQCLVGC